MKRLLVADNDSELLGSVESMLAPYYVVDTATSGLEVLDLFEKNHYTGLIIDVDFEQGINGLQIAERLRKKSKDLRIIIFSATNYSDAERQQAIDIGATFHEKPLPIELIIEIMEK